MTTDLAWHKLIEIAVKHLATVDFTELCVHCYAEYTSAYDNLSEALSILHESSERSEIKSTESGT